ncbi:MAG: hypothetical protein JWM70_1172, partial [Microbacteriaceae bacterium]|nr:hypothetical protein [Microbacteriaceae bacterium]
DAQNDQHDVRNRADEHDRHYVTPSNPLTENEGVLGTDGDDEREPESEAGDAGQKHSRSYTHGNAGYCSPAIELGSGEALDGVRKVVRTELGQLCLGEFKLHRGDGIIQVHELGRTDDR